MVADTAVKPQVRGSFTGSRDRPAGGGHAGAFVSRPVCTAGPAGVAGQGGGQPGATVLIWGRARPRREGHRAGVEEWADFVQAEARCEGQRVRGGTETP